MEKDGVIDKYLSHDIVLNSENIILLHVSATPYNIDVLKKLSWNPNNTIRWDDVANSSEYLNAENKKYNGLVKLLETEKLQAQSDRSEKCSNILENIDQLAHLFINKKYVEECSNVLISLSEISILIEYLVTLHVILLKKSFSHFNESEFNRKFALHEFVTKETRSILDTLINNVSTNGYGSLVVLRMNNSDMAEKFKKWMKRLLVLFKMPNAFDIVLDISDNDQGDLWANLSSISQFKYLKWRGINENPTHPLSYSDLTNIPMLLIVIEKGRMGDTIDVDIIVTM